MNNICPRCGGKLNPINVNVDSIILYGCVDCHRVFWGTDKDPIPPKRETIYVPDNGEFSEGVEKAINDTIKELIKSGKFDKEVMDRMQSGDNNKLIDDFCSECDKKRDDN